MENEKIRLGLISDETPTPTGEDDLEDL